MVYGYKIRGYINTLLAYSWLVVVCVHFSRAGCAGLELPADYTSRSLEGIDEFLSLDVPDSVPTLYFTMLLFSKIQEFIQYVLVSRYHCIKNLKYQCNCVTMKARLWYHAIIRGCSVDTRSATRGLRRLQAVRHSTLPSVRHRPKYYPMYVVKWCIICSFHVHISI